MTRTVILPGATISIQRVKSNLFHVRLPYLVNEFHYLFFERIVRIAFGINAFFLPKLKTIDLNRVPFFEGRYHN